MSLKNYGYWSGKLKGVELPDNATGVHALLELDTSTSKEATHASINIRSKLFNKSRLIYWLDQSITIPDDVACPERGWREIIHLACLNHRNISLDYLRFGQDDRLDSAEMLCRVDDIGDYLEHLINNAIEKDATAHI
ncbi:hypothetical protein ACHAPA_008688 [Fusarium lateritium]